MNQATREQWNALYEIADTLRGYEPWHRFGDLEIIGLTPKGFKDPFFVSVMGMETGYYGFLIYMGLEGFKDFARLTFSSRIGIPESYAFYEQTYLACRFVKYQELNEYELETLAKTDREYEADDWVPLFESAKKGYFLDELDELAVILLTHLFHELKAPLLDESTYEATHYEEGYYIHKRFIAEENQYEHRIETLPRDLILVDEYEVADQLLIKKVAKQPVGLYRLELDIVHLPFEIPSSDGKRLIMPKMIVGCNVDTGEVMTQELIGEGMDVIATLLHVLSELIIENGRMRELYVCNTMIVGMIMDFCKKAEISLHRVEALLNVEAFVEGLKSLDIEA